MLPDHQAARKLGCHQWMSKGTQLQVAPSSQEVQHVDASETASNLNSDVNLAGSHTPVNGPDKRPQVEYKFGQRLLLPRLNFSEYFCHISQVPPAARRARR